MCFYSAVDLEVAVGTEVLNDEAVIDTVPHEAGEVDGGYGQTGLLTCIHLSTMLPFELNV